MNEKHEVEEKIMKMFIEIDFVHNKAGHIGPFKNCLSPLLVPKVNHSGSSTENQSKYTKICSHIIISWPKNIP